MALATLLIIVLVVTGLIVAVPFAVGATQAGRNRISASQKTELAQKRELIRTIERLAIENQDVNPELAYQIRDEIRTSELKELS